MTGDASDRRPANAGSRASGDAEQELQTGEGKRAQQHDACQLQLIADALPVLVAGIDGFGRYRFVNAAYARWFGCTKEHIVGKTLAEVLGDDGYERIRPYVEEALAGKSVAYESGIRHRDAGTRYVEAFYAPQVGADGVRDGFIALISDISQRKRRERFRARRTDRSERLLKITAAIADAVTPEQVFEAAVDHVAEAVEASTAALWLIEGDERMLSLTRASGYPAGVAERFNAAALDGERRFPALDCARRGEPIFISSQRELLLEYPGLASSVSPGRAYRVACLPLVTRGSVVGVLGLSMEEAREPIKEEREFLLIVARYASQAVERLRLLEAERDSRAAADAAAQRLEVLNRASRAFSAAELSLANQLQVVANEVSTALSSLIAISLVTGEHWLQLAAIRHPDPQADEDLRRLSVAAPAKVGEGVTGTIAATGESVLIPHITAELVSRAPAPYGEFLRRFPTYALMGTALRARGRVIGTVVAIRTRADETFNSDDLTMLEELAERAAIAMENSRLHEETLQARKRAEQLYRFADSVVSAESIDRVFQAALDAMEHALGTRRSAVLLFDSDNVMRFRAWRGLSEDYRSAVEEHSPWAPDAADPRPVVITNVETDQAMGPYRSVLRQEGIGALAFVPIVNRGHLLGKFMVYHSRPHVFEKLELELAMALANHLGSVSARFSLLEAERVAHGERQRIIHELEQTLYYNDVFAGVLAHDLRNPMAAIMTAAQLLLRRLEGEGDRTAKPINRILSSGERMLRMIEQLLDFTRIRVGGGLEMVAEPVDLGELCQQVLREFEDTYPEWRISYEVLGDPVGSWDGDRLLQVISNLVGNAVQHGEWESGVRLRVDGGSESVELSVHNVGVIPAEKVPTLFEPFRGIKQRVGRSQGLGLGLFITNQIVLGHGGSLEVESNADAGTTFRVVLPRGPGDRSFGQLGAGAPALDPSKSGGRDDSR